MQNDKDIDYNEIDLPEGYLENLWMHKSNKRAYTSHQLKKISHAQSEVVEDFECYVCAITDASYHNKQELTSGQISYVQETAHQELFNRAYEKMPNGVPDDAEEFRTYSDGIDKEQVISLVTNSPEAFYFLSDKHSVDFDVALAAVTKNPSTYEFLNDTLKEDKRLALIAITDKGENLQFAPNTLKKDKAFVLQAVHYDGMALIYASRELRNDVDVLRVAIDENYNSLQFASSSLRDNRTTILEAVNIDKLAIYYASKEIRKLVGEGDPVEVLTKAVASEKLAAKLNNQLRPRIEPRQQSMKI